MTTWPECDIIFCKVSLPPLRTIIIYRGIFFRRPKNTLTFILTHHSSPYVPLCPKIPHPPKTSRSPQTPHSSAPTLLNPSRRLCSPNSPHRISKFPSNTLLIVTPVSHPPSAPWPTRHIFGFSAHAFSKLAARKSVSDDSRRYDASERGVRSARVPDCDVVRIW